MGLEIVALYIVLALGGAFGVSKGVEVYKHGAALDADKYAACVDASKDPKACRTLE